MSNPSTITGEQMAGALQILGVNFLFGETNADALLHKQPDQLILALAESHEARLRLSLIPLFLELPEFSKYVRKIAQGLSESAQVTLQCYYTAAVLLQRKHRAELDLLAGKKQPLIDLFSQKLGLLLTTDPEQDLQALAKRHEILSGMRINWLGTYQHALQVWMRGLEIQKS
ncbi:MAG: hypothetical protein HYZ24_14720 [Chloroflexi bacterium]|nr:hypothetical protein [Chloroflexota bacterium]